MQEKLLGRGRGRLELCEVGEEFGAVFVGIYAHVGLSNGAGGIDEKGVAGGKFGDAEIQERTVGRRDFVLCIREQFET